MREWRANGCVYRVDETAGYQSAVIPMKAHGKARPRVTVNGTYMPRDYKDARSALRSSFGTVIVKIPCAMKLTIVRKLAASVSKKQRAALMWTFCQTKPDNDNIEGWVMDALFDEDAAVVWTECIKVWGPRDLLHIELWEVNSHEEAINGSELMARLE